MVWISARSRRRLRPAIGVREPGEPAHRFGLLFPEHLVGAVPEDDERALRGVVDDPHFFPVGRIGLPGIRRRLEHRRTEMPFLGEERGDVGSGYRIVQGAEDAYVCAHSKPIPSTMAASAALRALEDAKLGAFLVSTTDVGSPL